MDKKLRITTHAKSHRELLFVQNLAKGLGKRDSAVLAGYKPSFAETAANRLMKRPSIIAALEKAGLTDEALSRYLKVNIKAGLGKKASASDSLRGIEIAAKMKGYYKDEVEPGNQFNIQNNININELRAMTDEELDQRLKTLTAEIAELQVTDATVVI